MDPDQKTWTYGYNALGSVKTVTAQDGKVRTWTYNARNQLVQEQHPESGTTLYTYDEAGMLATQTDAKGTVFSYAYDGNDRLKSINAGTLLVAMMAYEPGSDNRRWVSNGSTETTYTYDAAGRLVSRNDVVDQKHFTTVFEYDAQDNLHAIRYPTGRRVESPTMPPSDHGVAEPVAGRDYALGITYHPSGGITGFVAGNSVQTAVTYDPKRYWPTSITSGALELTYSQYDRVGNVKAIGDSRSGFNQTFTYDAVDRLQRAIGPYGDVTYPYDIHGNRQSHGGTNYTYESTTLRLSSWSAGGVTFNYQYDNNGNMTSAPSSTVRLYDAQSSGECHDLRATTSYGYDADDWRVRKSTASGSTIYYVRGPNGELLTEWKDPGTATATVRDYVYAGNRLLASVQKTFTDTPEEAAGGSAPTQSDLALTDWTASLATSLVALYRMDEGAGTYTINRVNGQPAVFAGTTQPSWSTSDASISFPGGAANVSYLDAGPDLALAQLPTTATTLVAKVYVSTLAAAGIVGKADGTLYYGMHGVAFGWDANGALRFSVGKAYTNMLAKTAASAVTTGQWLQVAVTYDGSGTAAERAFTLEVSSRRKSEAGMVQGL